MSSHHSNAGGQPDRQPSGGSIPVIIVTPPTPDDSVRKNPFDNLPAGNCPNANTSPTPDSRRSSRRVQSVRTPEPPKPSELLKRGVIGNRKRKANTFEQGESSKAATSCDDTPEPIATDEDTNADYEI